MVQNAFNSKVQALDQEMRALKMSSDEQKQTAATLQRKNSALEVELVDSHQRTQQLAEENKELFKSVQQLRRQLQRLDVLKKKVMESVDHHTTEGHNDNDSALYLRDDYLKGMAPMTHAASETSGSRAQSPPSRHTGAATPPMPMIGGYDPAAQNRMANSGGSALGGGAGLGASNAGGGFNSAVDGKAFFQQARSNLPYEAFNEFLANIKKLNNQQQTRDQTLEEARRIFGPDLRHLYDDFETLLSRHS
jgi:hypothetical protein